jgi:hypothetical protein
MCENCSSEGERSWRVRGQNWERFAHLIDGL